MDSLKTSRPAVSREKEGSKPLVSALFKNLETLNEEF